MIRILACSILSFVVTLALVPLVCAFCNRVQVLDRPGALKIHTRPIPRLGGVAIIAGVLAGMFAFGFHTFLGQIHLFAAMFLIWLIGLLDDFWGLHPGLRLMAQLAAGVLLWRGGWRLSFAQGEIVSLIAVCLFVLVFVNAFNFWDGSDGLAAGAACAVALSFAVLPARAHGSHNLSLALELAAACAAFLFWNFPAAKIFLGDSGSTLLGFLVAVLSLNEGAASDTRYMVIFPFAVAALPVFDALRIIVLRIARGVSPLVGDRCHIYDALLEKGWTSRTVALTSWSIIALCGAFSVFVIREKASEFWLVLPFALVAVWVLSVAAPQKQTMACGKPRECSSNCNAD